MQICPPAQHTPHSQVGLVAEQEEKTSLKGDSRMVCAFLPTLPVFYLALQG